MSTNTVATFKFVRIDKGDMWGETIYRVVNKRAGDLLAEITWYADWRRWVMSPSFDTVWSEDCLRDVAGFMAGLRAPAKRGGE